MVIALWLWLGVQRPQSVSQPTEAAEDITAVERRPAAEVACRFTICIFADVDEHTHRMYEALGMLAVAADFHIFILLSTLGSFVPRK